MMHMPNMMLMAGSDPYARWLDYVNAITAQDIADPNNTRAVGLNAVGWGLKRFTFPASLGGAMFGTCIGATGLGAYTDDSAFTRIAQHAFWTDALRVANQGRVVLLWVQDFGSTVANFGSLDRNGFTSSAYEPEYGAGWSTRFEYFNPATGKRVLSNPYGGVNTEFDL